ncbi:hypothetical protein [Brevundimonas sp.]|uniref:hypothetical protein n=1 Tax=Brevundimonas sp. TaxID=1871086 RepID=UPI002737D2EB|nr:hypothetical protein [Brevundimonas sp.]MDP3800811.1 hypothetical protein [Brevundimonas sp.]
MLRSVLATIAGVVIAFILVFLGDMLSQSLAVSAGPAPTDMNDRAAMEAYVGGLPTAVFIVMLTTWTVAAFAAAAFAARFGRRGAWPGWAAAGLFLCATAANLFLIPHPAWMAIAGVVLVVAAGWFGARAGSTGFLRAA